MKRRFLAPVLLLAGLTAFGNPAVQASDELAGALLGAGTGALLGHALGGRDAAVVGGFIGAMVGVAVADDDDPRVVVRRPHHVRHAPPAVVVYEAPRHRHAPPPIWAPSRHERRDWHGSWDGRPGHPHRIERGPWAERGW